MVETNDIRIHTSLFETLKAEKPQGVTWTHYLRELHREANHNA